MKKSDKSKKVQQEELKPEEVAPVEEATPEETAPVEEQNQEPAPEQKPAEEPAPAEDVAPEQQHVEEAAPEEQPVEEQKEEPAAPEEQPAEQQSDETETPDAKAQKKFDMKAFFSSKRNIGIVACTGAAVVALSLGLGLGLGLKHDEEPPAKTAFAVPTEVAVTESTSTISWKAVDGATNGYTLRFEESDKEMTLKVVSYNLLSDTSYLKEGVNSLYVKVNATDTYLESKYSAKVTYTYTPAQTEKTAFEKPTAALDADGKTLKWDAVTGATSYTVKIGGTELEPTTDTQLDLSTVVDTSVTATYKVYVKVNATDDHKESAYSDPVDYTYTHVNPAFEKPTAALDADGKTLKWDAVTGATSYTVKIGGTELQPTTDTQLDLSTVVDTSVTATYKVYVKVNATDDHRESEYSAPVDYTYTHVNPAFAVPANVKVEGDTLKWDAVTGATSYTVKIGSETVTVNTDNWLDLTTVTAKLVSGVNKLSVKANATDDHNESEYSTPAVDYNYKPAFAVPANVKVEGDTLKWDAVTGATSYTVKIGSETVTVNTDNWLDLTTVTAKLVSGINKISVKANATDDRKESEYSATVDYNYTPSAEVEAADYAALVEAIGSITADSTDTQAKAVAAAISTANNKYNGLSAEAKALDEVIAAKATFDTKKAAYEGVYNPAKAAYDTFAAALEEAVAVAAEEEDAAALNTKVTALNTANGALNTLAQSMVSAAQTTSYNTVKETLTAWNTAIDTAKEIWAEVTAASFNAIEGTDAQKLAKAEQNITAANALIAQYSDKKYVQNAVIEGTTKISDKKTIADTALASAKTAIETIVGTLKTTVNAFTGTIASENVNDAYLAELNGKKALVDGFGTYAGTLWTTELTTKLTNEIAAVQTAIAKKNAIAAAVAEIQAADAALTNDDEEIIAAVDTFENGTYANYADYITQDAGVGTAYNTYTAKRTAAQTRIKTRINAIKTATVAVLEDLDNNEIEDNYNALVAKKAVIEGETGAYASEYLSTLKIGEYELIQAVENAINKMLTTVVSSDGGEAYSLTGTTLKITLFRTFYNFRDEKITVTGDLAPKLTVRGNTVEVAQDFEKNDLNEYVAIINIENTGVMGDDASYTVGSETTPLKFGETIGDNPFFTNVNEIEGEDDGFKKAIVDGNFNMTFQNGCTAEHYYLEVYNADAITVDGAFVKFTEMPLGKIEVDGESVAMTRDELNRFLLNSNLSSLFLDNTLTVRFMIYGTTVTNGVPAFTAMNHSVISEAIDFSLTAEDAKTAISTFNNTVFDLGVYDSGVFSLISSGNIKYGEEIEENEENIYVPAFLDQFNNEDITADNIENYLRIKVSAYKESDDSLLFSTTTLFKNQAYNYHTFIREWARDRINKGVANETVNFYLTLSIVPIENTDLAQVFRESSKVNVNKQGPYTGTHTFKEGDDKTSINLPNALVSTDISNEGVFTLITEAIISDEFAAQFGNSDITKDNVKDYLQIKISAYAAEDTAGENELFYAIAPFRAGGYNYNTFIKDWTVKRYPDGVQNDTIQFYFMYTVQLKGEVNNAANPLLSDFKDSERIKVDEPSGLYTGTHTFDYVEITLHNIIDAGVWNGGNFSLITAYNEGIADVVNNYDNFTGQFNNVINGLTITKDNIKDYLQIKVTAYADTDTENANELFSAIAPFENQGYNYHAFIKSWSVYHYQNAANKNETVNFKLTLTIQLKEEVNGAANPFSKYFKDSVSTPVRQENDFNGSYEFKESDVKLPDTNQLNKTNEPILFQGFDVANDIINGYISHMEIHFAKIENATDPVNPSTYETAYVYYYKNNNGDDTFVVYKNADKSDEGLVFNKGGNEYWRGLTDVNNWFKSYDPDFDITGEGWYFRTRLIDNTEDDRYIVGEGISGWTTFYTPAD